MPVRVAKCPGAGKSVHGCEPALGPGERALGAPSAQKTLRVKPRSRACPEGHPGQETMATECKFLLIIQLKTPSCEVSCVPEGPDDLVPVFFTCSAQKVPPSPMSSTTGMGVPHPLLQIPLPCHPPLPLTGCPRRMPINALLAQAV